MLASFNQALWDASESNTQTGGINRHRYRGCFRVSVILKPVYNGPQDPIPMALAVPMNIIHMHPKRIAED
jgi:hypothetical protein